MTTYIKCPFTNKTFTMGEWELEKEKRKESMYREK